MVSLVQSKTCCEYEAETEQTLNFLHGTFAAADEFSRKAGPRRSAKAPAFITLDEQQESLDLIKINRVYYLYQCKVHLMFLTLISLPVLIVSLSLLRYHEEPKT